MTSTTPTVLAVGAAVSSAGLVVPELARRGARVCGLVRNADQGDAVRERGAAEVAVGDLTDRTSLNAALEDVDSVFYIAPAFIPDEAGIGKAPVEEAVIESGMEYAILQPRPLGEKDIRGVSHRTFCREAPQTRSLKRVALSRSPHVAEGNRR